MSFDEREYQTKAIDGVISAFREHPSTLLAMATGTGKTNCFARIIKHFQPARAMVLAHRNELIVQAKNKIEEWAKLSVDIEKADIYANTNIYSRSPVVVSSIQTQISGPKDNRRYLRFDPNEFGLLVADECHHSTSASWREVIAHYQKNPNLKLLGVTATPDRSDEEALGQVFKSVAFQYGIHHAIDDGYLVEITQQYVTVKSLDFSHVRTTAGDLNEGDLSKVMETEENVQGICQPSMEVMFGLPPKTLDTIPVPKWREYLSALGKSPRRTIIFTVSVAQAEMCANVFSRAMDGVEWVCGKTKKESRASILSRLLKGETHAVVNCGILTEGFDDPHVEVIVMARPTKSRSLYTQIIGRATRTLPGVVDGIRAPEDRRAAIKSSPKPFCRILDFVGNSGRHKLVGCIDILGGKVSEKAKELAKEKMIKDGKPVRVAVTLSNAEIEIEKKKAEEEKRRRMEKEARKSHLVARTDYKLKSVNPFVPGEKIPTDQRVSRDGRTFSEKQAAVLRKAGFDPNKLGYRQGNAIIGKIRSKASDGQSRVLFRAGYSASEVAAFDFNKASAEITKLKANNWRRVAA